MRSFARLGMHRRGSPSLPPILTAVGLIIAAFAPLGCGDDPVPGIRISFSSAALAAQTDVVVLLFFLSPLSCEEAANPFTRPVAAAGPYMSKPLGEGGLRNGIRIQRTGVPSGTYTVVVEAQNASRSTIGFGCTPDQTVEDSKTTQIQVRIRAAST